MIAPAHPALFVQAFVLHAFVLHPALLALGGALVAVPILIHLLSRRQVRRTPWAAMQWLLAAIRRQQRRLRLENWLVLALRVAAVALLALALARPIVTNPTVVGLLGRAKRSVYVVLDNSFSTTAKATARSVADLVKSEADRVLSGLQGEDTVAVVVTNDPRADTDGTEPWLLLPRTVGRDGAARAKEALAGVRPRDARANWPDALRKVQAQMAPEDVNRVVVCITDFQGSDWEARTRSGRTEGDPVAERLTTLATEGAAIRVVNVGGDARRNLAIREIAHPTARDTARDAFVGRSFRVDVKVANFGPSKVTGAKLEVRVDGDDTGIRRVEVPPLEGIDPTTREVKGEVVIPIVLPANTFGTPGPHVILALVQPPSTDPEADALALDSEHHHVLLVREQIRVLAWAQTGPQSRTDAETYLGGVYGGHAELEVARDAAASRVPPVYALKTASSASDFVHQLRGGLGPRPDLVVLANVTPRAEAADAIVDHVRDGGALLAFVGPSLDDPAAWNEPFHADPERRILPFAVERLQEKEGASGAPPEGFRLDFEQDTDHPLAQAFREEGALDLLRQMPIQVRGRMPFTESTPVPPPDGGAPEAPPPAGEGRVVLRFGDRRPAIVAGRYGQGQTVWVGTSVDESWLDEKAPTFFLPVFLDEAGVWLTRPDDRGLNREVGERVTASLPRDAAQERVAPPGGGEFAPQRRGGERETDRPLAMFEVGAAGIWRLTYRREGVTTPPSFVEPFAVNVTFEEGALAAARAERVRERLPPEADVAFLTSWTDAPDAAADAQQGDASRLLLWVLLAVLAAESIAAWSFGRRRSLVSEDRP